jgi:hypothetical protein
VNDEITEQIHNTHDRVKQDRDTFEILNKQRDKVKQICSELKRRIDACQTRGIAKSQFLFELEPSLRHIDDILLPKHEKHCIGLTTAIGEISIARTKFEEAYTKLSNAINEIFASIEASTEGDSLIETW